jgi:hypothetical protein
MMLFLIASCSQEQAPVAEPATEEPAAVAAASELLPHQELARDLLKELIEIDTTHSNGDNTAAAQAMADRLLAAGFPPEDVHVLAPVERKGNLVARYRGRDSERKSKPIRRTGRCRRSHSSKKTGTTTVAGQPMTRMKPRFTSPTSSG